MQTEEPQISISLKPQWMTNQTELENLPKKKREYNNKEEKNYNNRNKTGYQTHYNGNKNTNNGRNFNLGFHQNRTFNNSKNAEDNEFVNPPHTTRDHHTRKMQFQSKNKANSRSFDSLKNKKNFSSNNNSPNNELKNNNNYLSKSPYSQHKNRKYYAPKKIFRNNFDNYNKEENNQEQKNENLQEEKKYSIKKILPKNYQPLDISEEDSIEFENRNRYSSKFDSYASTSSYSSSNSSNSSSNTCSEINTPINRYKKKIGLNKYTSSPELQKIEFKKSHPCNKPLTQIAKSDPPKIFRAGSDSSLPFSLSTLPSDNLENPTSYSSLKSSLSKIREEITIPENEETFLKQLGWSPSEESDEEEWILTDEEINQFKIENNESKIRENILKMREKLKSDFEVSIKTWINNNK